MSRPPSPHDQSPYQHDLEAFWRAISTSSLDGFWINSLDGRLLDVNDAYCRMSGYSREELLTMRVRDLEALESPEEILAHAGRIREQRCDRFETQHRRKDSSLIDLDVSLTLIEDHDIIVAFLRDISSAKADRRQLERTLDFNRNLLETANVLIVGLNRDGDVVFFNPYAEKVTGYSAEKLVGRNWFDLLVPRARYPQVHNEFERLLAGGIPTTFENPILTRGGNERYISWSNTELVEDGLRVGTLSFGTDITDKKRAKDELHASQQRYTHLVETAQDLFWRCDHEGHVVYVNPAITSLFGYAPDEVLDRRFHAFIPPEQSADGIEFLQRLKRDGAVTNFESTLLRKNGERAGILVNASKVYNSWGEFVGFQGTIKDITERKRAEEALRVSEQYQRAIIHNAPFGALHFRLGGDGELLFEGGNPAAESILEIALEARLGQSIDTVFPGLEGTDIPTIFTRLAREGGSHHLERFTYQTDAIQGTYEVDAFQTVPEHMAVFFTDITERLRNEQELVRAREEALQASRAKDDFLGVISHELRTPLTPILGFAEMLALQCESPEQQDLLHHIEEAGHRMLRLVEDILDFSRIANKPPELQPRPFLPGTFFRRELQNAEERNTNNRLLLDAPDGSRFQPCPEGLSIVADPELIAQVLGNLIHNACKFTDQGTVTVRYGVEVGNDDRGTLLFEVEDTGIGIAPDKLATIWEPFSQVDTSASRSFSGVGLGLSICRKLVERLDGVIDVSSAPGRGSCFRILLPVTFHPWAEPGPNPPGPDAPPRLSGPVRILIVEDNDLNRLSLETQIRSLGGEPFLAVDSEDALDLMRIYGPAHFDLALLDLHLPGISGFELSTTLSESFGQRHLPPLVGISADVSDRARSEALRSGMQEFLAKPVVLTQLQALFEQLIHSPPTST